jgi:hypothetical protein
LPHGTASAATTLSAGAALTVLAGYAAVLAGAGAALTARREIAISTANHPTKPSPGGPCDH